MKILLTVLVCIVAVECLKGGKGKTGKTVKTLKGLCSAWESGYLDVSDDTFDDIFSDAVIGTFCDNFFDALNETAKDVFKRLDGIKALAKACKSEMKKPTTGPSAAALVGFDAICNASEEAGAQTLNDRGSKKALSTLRQICTAQEDGKLKIKISNYTEVFEDLEGFCGVFMNETTEAMDRMKKDKVDGIRKLGEVCRWYSKKFDEFTPESSLALLGPICEDYDEIKMALK